MEGYSANGNRVGSVTKTKGLDVPNECVMSRELHIHVGVDYARFRDLVEYEFVSLVF